MEALFEMPLNEPYIINFLSKRTQNEALHLFECAKNI